MLRNSRNGGDVCWHMDGTGPDDTALFDVKRWFFVRGPVVDSH